MPHIFSVMVNTRAELLELQDWFAMQKGEMGGTNGAILKRLIEDHDKRAGGV